MDPDALAFYEHALATGETAAERVGWRGAPGSQLANFAALCGAAEVGDGDSLLDVGCGTGELVAFLATTGRRVAYTGVDTSARMIEAARAEHPEAVFEVRDVLADPPARRFEVVLCSGTLNYTVPDHGAWAARMIARMYELAGRVLVFNLLNAAVPASLTVQLSSTDDNFFRVTPEEVLQLCRRIAPHIEIHDAGAGTFTVVLRRHPSGTVAKLAAEIGAGHADDPALHAVAELAKRRGLHAELRELLAAAEPTAAVVVRLAAACTALGDHAAAEDALRRAYELAPSEIDTVARLGHNARERGDLEGELRWWREALAVSPAHPIGRYKLVETLIRAGRRDEARAAALAAPAGALRELLDGATADSPESALAAFERAVALAPRSLDALTSLAIRYEGVGRWREAAALWQRAIGLNAGDPRLQAQLQRARRHS